MLVEHTIESVIYLRVAAPTKIIFKITPHETDPDIDVEVATSIEWLTDTIFIEDTPFKISELPEPLLKLIIAGVEEGTL